MGTVAELIEGLFRTHRRPDGREWTHKEVCDALGDLAPSHLSRLRSGKITNPGRDVLLSLCRFFRVQPSYFFPELQREELSDTEGESVPVGALMRSVADDPTVQQLLGELLVAAERAKRK